MIRSVALPFLALVSFTFMTWHLVKSHQPIPDVAPPLEPSRSPFAATLAGAGIVEPRSENLLVAALVPGVVTAVQVEVGQRVTTGTLLFQLDDRQPLAELAVQQALLAEAEANLHRAQRSPRPEDVPPSAARVERARAELKAQQDLMDRAQKLLAKQAWSEEDSVQRRQMFLAAQAGLTEAEAQHARLLAGTWKEDLAIAETQVERARRSVAQAEVEVARLRVRAPIDGTILKVNVRPGEFVGTPPGQTLIVMGDLTELHVRVDIDEQDLPRFRPGMSGVGYVRGDGAEAIPLRFVRIEPLAEPKKSLTNAGNERVDTRVLQVIYALQNPPAGIYVGQQVDVFLDAGESSKSVTDQSLERSDGGG